MALIKTAESELYRSNKMQQTNLEAEAVHFEEHFQSKEDNEE